MTQILERIELGDHAAAEQLLPLVYAELRKLVGNRLAHEAQGQTLQATDLVHEAYLRLVDGEKTQQWNSRGHFFAAAAKAMRRILVERARQKKCYKRGGDLQRQQLSLNELLEPEKSVDIEALDQALDELEHANPPAAKVVELRYFAGLSAAETAAALGVSERTVQRYWVYAKAWLLEELRELSGPCDSSVTVSKIEKPRRSARKRSQKSPTGVLLARLWKSLVTRTFLLS